MRKKAKNMKKRNYKKYLFISLAFLLVFSIIFGSGIASAEDNLENKTVDTEELEEKEEEFSSLQTLAEGLCFRLHKA